MQKFYIVTASCGDPQMNGPYPSADARDAEARRMVREEEIDPVNDDDAIYGLNIEDGEPVIFPFTTSFFEDDDGVEDDMFVCEECGRKSDIENSVKCPKCDGLYHEECIGRHLCA